MRASRQLGQTLILVLLLRQDVARLRRPGMRTSCTVLCASQQADPNSLPANRPAFSSLYPPLLPHCVLFTPPHPLPSTLSQNHSDLAATCVPASYRCVYHPSICLSSFQREGLFCLEGQKKTLTSKTPPPPQNPHGPPAQMDHRAFIWTNEIKMIIIL